MDTVFLATGILTLVMVWVTFSAWRSGNEARDVKLIGATTAMLGLGTAVSALV